MAHFGLRYFAQLRSKYKGVLWRVEIVERDYSGPSEEMEFAGGSPLSITWENRGDEFYVPVKAYPDQPFSLYDESVHHSIYRIDRLAGVIKFEKVFDFREYLSIFVHG